MERVKHQCCYPQKRQNCAGDQGQLGAAAAKTGKTGGTACMAHGRRYQADHYSLVDAGYASASINLRFLPEPMRYSL